MPTHRSDDLTYSLASNASATGAAVAVRGGIYEFGARGTVGGSTISLQMQLSNANWTDVFVYSWSVVKSTSLPYSQTGIRLPACNVRMAATGGAPSGLFAHFIGLR